MPKELPQHSDSMTQPRISRRTALGIIGAGLASAMTADSIRASGGLLANPAVRPSNTLDFPIADTVNSPIPVFNEGITNVSPVGRFTDATIEPYSNPEEPLSAERIPGLIYPGDVIFSVPEKRRKAFITVDDCNTRSVIKQWLRVGREKNASFTFFPTGISVEQDYDLFIQALEEGHGIGIHSRSHPDLAPLPLWKVKAQIGSNLTSIRDEVSPDEPVDLLRLPYGSGINDREVKRAARYYNLAIVQWNNSAGDAFLPTGNEARDVRRVVRNLEDIRGGDIVLFHANFRHSPLAALEVLDIMKSKGLTAARLSENLQLSPEVGQPPGT